MYMSLHLFVGVLQDTYRILLTFFHFKKTLKGNPQQQRGSLVLHEDVLQQNTAIFHSLQSQRERHKVIERGHSILFKSCCKEVKLTWGGCYIREECAHSFLMQVRALSVQGREQMGCWWRAHASWMALCILLQLCHASNSPAVSSAWIKHNSAQLTSFMQLQTFFL